MHNYNRQQIWGTVEGIPIIKIICDVKEFIAMRHYIYIRTGVKLNMGCDDNYKVLWTNSAHEAEIVKNFCINDINTFIQVPGTREICIDLI